MYRPEEIIVVFLLQYENCIHYVIVFLITFPLVNICVFEGWGVRAHVLVAKVKKNLLTFYSSPAMTRFLFRFKAIAFSVFLFFLLVW